MRYPHLYNLVHFRPWLIQPAFHAAIAQVLEAHLEGRTTNHEPRAENQEPFIGSGFAPVTIDSDGIATIPIHGIIAKGASAFEKSCYGGVSPEDVTQSLAAATSNPNVRGVVLHVDSPGGTVGGVQETAEAIAGVQQAGRIPVFAHTDGMMASAAYWLSAGASRIYATRLADVGSIGVYLPWMDRTEQFAKEGVKVDLIKDGKHKGAGFPGTKLTEDDRARLQEDVNRIGAEFRAHVTHYRPRVARDTMEGQTFLGVDAAENGLIDGLASTLAEVKAKLRLTLPA